MSFYENAEKLKGQKIAFCYRKDEPNYVIDYISGEPIKIPFLSDWETAPREYQKENAYFQASIGSNVKFLQCKDIVLKGDQILAVVEYEQGCFAVPVMSSLNQNFYHLSFDEKRIDMRVFDITDFRSRSHCMIVSEQDLKNAVSSFNAKQEEQKTLRLNEEQAFIRTLDLLRQARLKDLTLKYGAEMASVIAEGIVKIGMTQEMCMDAWGIPNETYTTTTAAGSAQVWMYNYKTRLYFVNNRLNIIQN